MVAKGEVRLNAELERLKKLFGLAYNLIVIWEPSKTRCNAGDTPQLSGQVLGDTIYIYELDEEKAVETLRHEFLDYCISQAIQPYKEVTNRLIRMINDDVYRRKEKIVEALVKLLGSDK